MKAAALLLRLEGVRRTGPHRWLARCPAHDDKHPSLAIRELADGRVLLHCFADCAANDVLDAVGLEFSALFPDGPIDHSLRRERRPFPAEDVLRALGFEALLAAITAARVAYGIDGVTLDEVDRLILAAQRMANAATAAGVDADEHRVRERLQRHRQAAEAA
jgi:hypothetical protein